MLREELRKSFGNEGSKRIRIDILREISYYIMLSKNVFFPGYPGFTLENIEGK